MIGYKLLGILVSILLCGTWSLYGQDNPGVYHRSWEALLKNRSALQQTDSPLRPALNKLLSEADEALQMPLQSVLDKVHVAKSGDKKDYLSIGRYSWPNPNTADGLPWVTRDGEVGPGVSDETDFLRFGRVNRSIETLSMAYFFTGHQPYAERTAKLIRHWYLDSETGMNPHFTYAQIVPGVRDENTHGYGVIEANGLSSVMDAVGLIRDSGEWSSEDDQAMLDWFNELFQWLQESPHARAAFNLKHNIGTWFDGLTAHIALFCSKEDEALRILSGALQRRIQVQIEPDGSQPHEQRRRTSFNYYLYNTNALLKCAILSEHVGLNMFDFESADGRSIRKAVAFVVPYLDENKTWVKEDIAGIRRTPLLTILACYLNYRADPEFEELFIQYGIDNQLDHRWRLIYHLPQMDAANGRQVDVQQ